MNVIVDTLAERNNASAHKPKAIVVGAGFGGIALAIRLQAQGFQTVLVDNRDKPGGRAYVYEQDGYKFDGGPTVITDPDCLEQLFALTGRDIKDYVTLLPVDPFFEMIFKSPPSIAFLYCATASSVDISKSPRETR